MALGHEFSAIIDDTWEAVLRLSACYEGFVEDSRTTAQEVEEISQVMPTAGHALLALLALSRMFLIAQPLEVGERLGRTDDGRKGQEPRSAVVGEAPPRQPAVGSAACCAQAAS